jgi:hypothetical protein
MHHIWTSWDCSTAPNRIYGRWNFKPAQQLRVSKFCESEMAIKDTHLVLWSTRAMLGISASNIIQQRFYIQEKSTVHWENPACTHKDTMQQTKKRVQFTLSECFRCVVQVIYRLHDHAHKHTHTERIFSDCANALSFAYVHSLQWVDTFSTQPNAAIRDELHHRVMVTEDLYSSHWGCSEHQCLHHGVEFHA